MNRSMVSPWFLAAFVRLVFLVLTKESSESGEGEKGTCYAMVIPCDVIYM